MESLPFTTPVAGTTRGPNVALIDDDNVQLQLYKAQLSKQGAKVTMFKNGQDFLTQTSDGQDAPYDAVVIDYHMPELNAMETIDRLEESFRESCKICVVSGNTLAKADRTSLDVQGIRFVQKNQSACCKILNLLSSPDLRKCSSCTKWKPLADFSGKATCNTCRPKKRKQGAFSERNKRATRDLLQTENEGLQRVVIAQTTEITALKSQVSMQHQTIIHLQQPGTNIAAIKAAAPIADEKPLLLTDPMREGAFELGGCLDDDLLAAPEQGFLLDSCMMEAQEEAIMFDLATLTESTIAPADPTGWLDSKNDRLSDEFKREVEQDERKQRSSAVQKQLHQMQAQNYARPSDVHMQNYSSPLDAQLRPLDAQQQDYLRPLGAPQLNYLPMADAQQLLVPMQPSQSMQQPPSIPSIPVHPPHPQSQSMQQPPSIPVHPPHPQSQSMQHPQSQSMQQPPSIPSIPVHPPQPMQHQYQSIQNQSIQHQSIQHQYQSILQQQQSLQMMQQSLQQSMLMMMQSTPRP